MKYGDLTVRTILTNEEAEVLDKTFGAKPLSIFNEREQTIIGNLVRKDVVTKITHKGVCMVVGYGQSKDQERI